MRTHFSTQRQQQRAETRKERKVNKAGGPILIGQGHKNIVGDDKMRANVCAKEVNALVDSYDCIMIPQVILEPGQPTMGTIKIAAKPRTGGPNNGGN